MTQQMTPEELAESVKRLRDIYACHNDADAHELMFAVNALVDLVGEMAGNIRKLQTHARATNNIIERKCKMYEICINSLEKSAPIAALAKEEA